MATYLDNNATTALAPEVLEAMLPYMGQVTGNPSSVHRFGRLQRDAIEQAREQVARLAGARAEQVIFTSCGTESNNLLIKGCSESISKQNSRARFAVSAIEHMSLIEPSQHVAVAIDSIGVDSLGRVTVDHLHDAMHADTALVSIMTANNETGAIQDIARLAAVAADRGCYFHTDASQAAGKIELDFSQTGVHAMTLSAHKLYGPVGAGALIIDKTLPITRQIDGGKQEKNLRAGTENVPAIVGFGKAAELALQQLHTRAAYLLKLRQKLEQGLKQMPHVHIFSETADRLPNTVQFGVHGFDGETLLMQLDRKAIAVSSGSACTSGKGEPSHVLKAMGIDNGLANSAIRVSFGTANTETDVTVLLAALKEIIEVNLQSPVMMAATV
jgi:cysteine desulfurase